MNIVFLDGFTVNPGDLSWKSFEKFGTFTVYDRTPAELVVERAADASILITNKARLTDEVFSRLPNLKLVCEAATGFDNIDVASARRHGVTVCNAAGYSSKAVAQLVASLVLEVADGVGEYAQANKEGAWSRSPDFCYWKRPRIELPGKRFTIVGFGNIGSTVANVMRVFGVELCAVTSKAQAELPDDVLRISLEEAFATSRFVSLNCPLNEGNREFVGYKLLAKANPELVIINTARGGLVDDNAVAEALHNNKIAAYCTDVMQPEPPSLDNPLFSAPRCFITPHIGWATPEARQRIIDIVVDNVRAFLAGTPKNVVN